MEHTLDSVQSGRFPRMQAVVLELVFQGKTNKVIGKALGISNLTVKGHVAQILRKLGAGNRLEAVYLALKSGFLKPPMEAGPETLSCPDNPEMILDGGTIALYADNSVAINGKRMQIGTLQRRYLEFFLRNPNRTLSRRHVLDSLMGMDANATEDRVVDVHVRRLRRLIAPTPFRIETVRGIGYVFKKR